MDSAVSWDTREGIHDGADFEPFGRCEVVDMCMEGVLARWGVGLELCSRRWLGRIDRDVRLRGLADWLEAVACIM
jgi:hypothetical protein